MGTEWNNAQDNVQSRFDDVGGQLVGVVWFVIVGRLDDLFYYWEQQFLLKFGFEIVDNANNGRTKIGSGVGYPFFSFGR